MKKNRGKYGLNRILEIVGLPKSTWYYWEKQKVTDNKKYGEVKRDLFQVAEDHSAYGYRRATSELKEEYGHDVGKNVVLRLMRDTQLQTIRNVKRPKPSVMRDALVKLGDRMNLVAQLEEIFLFEVSYTDFTELVYANGRRKARLMPIVEHDSKVVLGWALGKTADTEVALKAVEMAEEKVKKWGFSMEGLIVHHDQDPVYTGHVWLEKLLVQLKAKVSYALLGARDNPEMESFNGRFKVENESLFLDAENLEELERVVNEQMMYYNTDRRHSSLGNVAPLTYLKNSR